MELYALQKHLPAIKSAGASLVAITPELPDHTLTTVEKHALEFEVLSDHDNVVARAFGLVFEIPATLHDFYRSERVDLPATQGNESFELPVTGTFIADGNGIIRHAYVNVDFTKRQEPEEIVALLRKP